MIRFTRSALVTTFILVTAFAPAEGVAADDEVRGRAGDDGANVHFVVTIDEHSADSEPQERSIQALGLDGWPVKLLTGWRQPIAVTSFNVTAAERGAVLPATSYQYQDVGIRAQLEGRILVDDRIRVRGVIELSSVAATSETAASSAALSSTALSRTASLSPASDVPSIETISHEFDVILRNGVEAMLVEMPTPAGSSMILRLRATPVE